MAQTLLANGINPQVLADMISGKLTNAIRFANSIAEIDTTLTARPGNTITVPVWAYIGNAADLAEGIADVPVVLSASSTPATVKKVAKSVNMSDELLLSGYGDPMGEAADQLALAIGGKVDADVLTALKTTALTAGNVAAVISHAQVVAGVMKFADEEVGQPMFLFVHPNQYGELQLDAKFQEAAPEMLRSGIVGRIAGCDVIVSKQIVNGAPIISKAGAVKIYMKKDVTVETDRDVLAKMNLVAADQHYVCVLADASKAVKLAVLPTA
jgi:N4-gp56 family major capsid protein